MKLHNSTILIFLVSLMLVLASTSAVTAQESIMHQKTEGKMTLMTDQLAVEIVGDSNIPSFIYWKVSNDSLKYKVQFDQLFEINDTNSDGVYDTNDTMIGGTSLGLYSLGWAFSDFLTETDENGSVTAVHFNMTSADPNGNGPNQDISYEIQFNFHLYVSESAELKFDIIITNYEFATTTSSLVIGFKIKTEDEFGEGDIGLHGNGTAYSFGEAYFGSELNAQGGNDSIPVGLSSGILNLASKIYLTYPQFIGTLYHDPTLGVSLDSTVNTDDSNDGSDGGSTDQKLDDVKNYLESQTQLIPNLSKGDLVFSTVLGSLVFLAIPAAVYGYKRLDR